MKLFINALTFTILLTGCSTQNAFTKFEMTKQQELSISNSQTSKVKFKNKVDGIFTALYLNEIDNRSFNDNEYFYVYMYVKDKKQMNQDNLLHSIKLNTKPAIKIEELSYTNRFSNLTTINNRWNRYYLVTFKADNTKKLNLIFRYGEFSSDILRYKKR